MVGERTRATRSDVEIHNSLEQIPIPKSLASLRFGGAGSTQILHKHQCKNPKLIFNGLMVSNLFEDSNLVFYWELGFGGWDFKDVSSYLHFMPNIGVKGIR